MTYYTIIMNFTGVLNRKQFKQPKTSITKDVTLTLPNRKHPFCITVDSSFHGVGCVIFQMSAKGSFDNISLNSRILITNEEKLCTTYRELMGIVYSLTIYEHNIIGCDYLFPKPFEWSEANYLFIFLHCKNAIKQVSETLYYIYEKKISKAVMLSLSFALKELQQNQLKHKQLLPQFFSKTLTHGSQIKPVQYLVKLETVLPSRKDDCHTILAGLGIDHSSNRLNDKGENIIITPLISYSLEAAKHFQSH